MMGDQMVRADPGGGGGGSIAAIKNGGETLVNQGGNLRNRFSNLFLDTAPLAEIVSIGNWAHDQLPMLTRRQTLAAAIDDTPGAHFYDEYATGMYLSPAARTRPEGLRPGQAVHGAQLHRRGGRQARPPDRAGNRAERALPGARMDKVSSDFERASSNRPDAWNKGAMLAYAKVPGNWLGKVARNNALDDFAKDPDQDFRGGGLDAGSGVNVDRYGPDD
jgi:hypothetical protein